MKKQILFILLSVIFLTSCSTKDDPIEGTLDGTYYSAFAYSGGGYYISGIYFAPYDVYWSFRFIDKTTAEKTSNEKIPYGSLIGSAKKYTYIYSYPDIKLIDKEGNIEYGTFINKTTFRIGNNNYQKQP